MVEWNKNKIRVVLADDHPTVRTGIRRYLTRSDEIEVVGVAENGRQALDMVKALNPDVLLLDVEMPDLKGYEVVERITRLDLPVKTLALSAHNEKRYIIGMLTNGASGYLTKEEAPGKLLDAIRAVASGKKGWISPRVAEQLGMPNPPLGRKSIPRMTPQEKIVLARIAAGETDHQIGVKLNLDTPTVQKLVQSIITKLGAKSRLEAVLRAIREGLISDR
jgi:DNA-binding NarL/FixJ family response regulator